MDINKLKARQLEVNKLCGFKLDLDGLYLGYFAEVGELSSALALYLGFKKPKPEDLKKFGGWGEVGSPNLTHSMYTIDFIFAYSFDEAWKCKITKEALKTHIAHEAADVLVYLLQLSILKETDNWLNTDKHFLTLYIQENLLDITDKGFKWFDIKIKGLAKMVDVLHIDLEKAYYEKTDLLIKRFI